MSKLTPELIESYRFAKKQLADYKKLESELRIELLSAAFPDGNVGTHTVETGLLSIKGSFKNTFTLDKNIEEVMDSLSDAEKACIGFKPSLKLAVYNELEPELKEELDKWLTVKPAMPTVKIEEL
jgi:hypothetical protein